MLRVIDDNLAALHGLIAVRLRIGGDSSKRGFSRLADRIGGQPRNTPVESRLPRATLAAVVLVFLGLIGHAVFRTIIPNSVLAMTTWLIALVGVLQVARSFDSDLVEDRLRIFRSSGELAVFVLIFGLTAICRLWNLGELPATIHGDSAECGIQALAILQGKVDDIFSFSPWYYTPYPAHLPYAASFALVGKTVVGLRLPSAIIGILCMVPLYFLVRSWLGIRAAQICTTFFAVSHAAIHFSRIGLWNIQSLFIVITTAAFIALAIQKGRSLYAACAGIAAGLGFYTYTGGRLAIIAVAAFLASQLVMGSRKRLLVLGTFVSASFLVALSPLILSYMKSPDVLESDRTSSVLVLADEVRPHAETTTGRSDLAGILRVQTLRTLEGFWDRHDESGQSGIRMALVSKMTAVLALAGFLVALVRFREPTSRLILLWAGLGLLLGSILIIDPPSHTRLVVLFPVPFLLSTLTIETAFRWLERRGGRWAAPVVVTICLLVVGHAAVFNLSGYARFAKRIEHEARIWDIIEIVHEYGKDHDYYFFGGRGMPATAPPLRLFAKTYRMATAITPADIPQVLDRDTVFIIPTFLPENEHRLRHVGSVITERFPESSRTVIGDPDEPEFVLYEVPAVEPIPL